MSKTYLLIDLQNRHPPPEDVASWMGSNGEAWIFYGEHEIGLLAPYMELGDRVSLVDISRPGKNSLDFHLVLYLDYLVGRHEPGARFAIVAADGDYDPRDRACAIEGATSRAYGGPGTSVDRRQADVGPTGSVAAASGSGACTGRQSDRSLGSKEQEIQIRRPGFVADAQGLCRSGKVKVIERARKANSIAFWMGAWT